MIIFRYLAKEIYQTCAVIATVLLFVVICNQMIVYLTRAASGGMPVTLVFKIILIQIPLFLMVLLPLSFFLGVLMSYGRMYTESEMTVLGACGFSQSRLVLTTLFLSLFTALAVGYLSFSLGPKVTAYQYRLQANLGITTVIQTLMPGRFQSLNDGEYVIYLGGISRDRQTMTDVFVATKQRQKKQTETPQTWNVLTAKWANYQTDPKTGAQFLVCHDGYYYSGAPGTKNYQVVKFDQLGYWLQNKVVSMKSKPGAVPTMEIIRGYHSNPGYAAEFQKRISMPLMVLVVTLLAVPFSRVRPRQGKFNRLIPAILLYILYANTILVAQKWVQDGAIPLYLGLWWIHGIMLLICGWFLLDMYGRDKVRRQWRLWREERQRHKATHA